MDKPKIDTGVVYGKIAEMLPTEGRDFTVDSTYDESGKARLIITPLTPIGKAWVPFLMQELEKPLQSTGVSLGNTGAAAHETMTIASVRAKAEADAKAALTAKIAAAEKTRTEKYQAAMSARQARITSGSSSPSQDELRLNGESNDAARVVWKLKRVEAKIAPTRDSVDAEALKAAKDDEAKGKFWAVDMDAPLTSLFDQQDVAGKFRAKEDLILQIATRDQETDELRARAVNTAKQYIVKKGA